MHETTYRRRADLGGRCGGLPGSWWLCGRRWGHRRAGGQRLGLVFGADADLVNPVFADHYLRS